MTVVDWRRDLVTLLSSSERQDWDRANEIREAHLPSHLYRYRASNERSLATLARGTVWISSASKFNDLHDTSVVADAASVIGPMIKKAAADGEFTLLPPEAVKRIAEAEDALDALGEVFAESVSQQVGPEASGPARDFFRQFLAKQSAEWSTQWTAFFQARTKVACFCEAYDEPLLWAHYADSHQGFCIEYPISALPTDDLRRRWLWPVVYSKQPFDILSFARSIVGQMNKMNVFAPRLAAMHKAPRWAYEREWRIVDQTGDPGTGQEMR